MNHFPFSYYPRDRADAIQCLLRSSDALDRGDKTLAAIYHLYARAYINDHPDEFPDYTRFA